MKEVLEKRIDEIIAEVEKINDQVRKAVFKLHSLKVDIDMLKTGGNKDGKSR